MKTVVAIIPGKTMSTNLPLILPKVKYGTSTASAVISLVMKNYFAEGSLQITL